METNPEHTDQDFDLGRWLGRREAFGSIAGRCTAAEIQCLKQIRDNKLYQGRTASWRDFCRQYLGASRTHINRLIGHLEEFGPVYFQLSQVARVSPETFRAIAPAISDEGVRCGGEVIALLPENSQKVAAAIAELRRQAAPPAGIEVPALQALEKRCCDVQSILATMKDAPQADRCEAARSLAGILLSASRAGIDLFPGGRRR